MNTLSFNSILAWVAAQGYPLVFLGMCAEGPAVTAASAFTAALGHFNPWVILLLSILGDLIPDTIYYYIGFFGRLSMVKWIEKRAKATPSRLDKLHHLMHQNHTKTMLTLKFTPFIAIPGFIMIGAKRWSYWRFIWVCALITVPKSIILVLLGYYAGDFLKLHPGYLERFDVVLLCLLFLFIGVPFLYSRISVYIANRLEKKV